MGNPDTSTNVATLVPGTESRLAGSPSTAVIRWVGYDAPQNILEAGGQQHTANAKADLARFQEGLRASHTASVAAHDVIKATNIPLGTGIGLPTADPHGPDPTLKGFGGKVFSSDPGTPGWLPGGLGEAAHSEYWRRNSASLTNMGKIIAGKPADRAETHTPQALARLPSQARLERVSAAIDNPCDVPSDNGPRGRVEARNTYQVLGRDPAEFPRAFDTHKNYWTAGNHTLLEDKRPTSWFRWVRDNTDAFTITLQANDLGELYLGSTSPCGWPDGQPR
ncbi:alpha/beta hydrolase [Crossiella cryophila]|uniref:DUF1023 domain-containing protein n=1 Tax=Crossiella cryophila TaxID=43355 RepID=A0A7W7FXN1_9PSEU|nr:alpha/beta hydrolase [Crossiella cryophila]MBB4681275.1 hypothetical protein [Crossiella cryophila]